MATVYRTEPEFVEYLDGKAHPKVSPRVVHGLIQFRIGQLIGERAAGRGHVSTETDAVVGRRDGRFTRLIPDVSFITPQQFAGLSEHDRDEPPFAPEIAVEVRSPGDDAAYLRAKIARYLGNGSKLVLDVDPARRTVAAYAVGDERTFAGDDAFEHPAVPWLTFGLRDLFCVLDPLRGRQQG